MSTDLPALLGGKPVFPEGPPAWPLPDPDVERAAAAALADGSWGQYHGPHIPELEGALQQNFAVEEVLTCSSGTLAVETALRAVKVAPGDEVILPAYDYEANFLCIHAVGALPVLVDIRAENATLDPGKLEAAYSPRVKAVLVSHLHGGLAAMEELRRFTDLHGIALIEDAAQASGALLEHRAAGTWGDVGILSFGGSKLLSAGRGGALLFRSSQHHQRARVYLSRGVQQWAALSELQAAVLLPQLDKLPQRTRIRHDRVRYLIDRIRDLPGLRPFCNEGVETTPAYYKLGFYFDSDRFGLGRDRFVQALRAEGVAFDTGFRALHAGRSPQRYRSGGPLTESERAHERVVILHHPVLLENPERIDLVAEALWKTYRNSQALRG